jgi:glycosyltransferase involved in cell wall biosynthesis
VISVVVPVRDAMPWLNDQLEALTAQQYSGEWEVLLVDNGSTDSSVATGQGWANRNELVRWMDASEVKGPGAARNAGVANARGDLLAFCDADDVVGPGWLAAIGVALVDADVVAGVYDFRSLDGLHRSPDSTAERDAPLSPAATSQLGFLPAGLGANLAVRRQAFEAVDGFAEELSVGEDIDLCWRLQLDGVRFAIASDAVVAKRGQAGFAQNFRHGTTYGFSGPTLYRRHRDDGARPDLRGAARSWLWLLTRAPLLVSRTDVRSQWAHAAGMRTGRLRGSLKERVFFP